MLGGARPGGQGSRRLGVSLRRIWSTRATGSPQTPGRPGASGRSPPGADQDTPPRARSGTPSGWQGNFSEGHSRHSPFHGALTPSPGPRVCTGQWWDPPACWQRAAASPLPVQMSMFRPQRSFFGADTGRASAEAGASGGSASQQQQAQGQQQQQQAQGQEEGGAGAEQGEEQQQQGAEDPREQEIAVLKDRVLRAYADMENMRDRMLRDNAHTKLYAVQSFAKGLLDVADNLGRASAAAAAAVPGPSSGGQAAPEPTLEAVQHQLKGLLEGVQATERQLLKVFKAHGLERFNPVDQAFDPNQHEAMFEVPDPSKEPGTVVQVLKEGYMLHGRVLRAAEVGVTRKPE